MDKKMMEKVNELLKANGKCDLNLDEMSKVSGGWREDQMTSEASKIWNGLLDEWSDARGGSDDVLRMIAEKIAAFGAQMKAKYDN